jgi:hypothetical protein
MFLRLLFVKTILINLAFAQYVGVQTGVNNSPNGTSASVGAHMRFPVTLLTGKIGKTFIGHKNNKSYIEYDFEINVSGFEEGFPMGAAVTGSNRFFKQDTNYFIGFGTPHVGYDGEVTDVGGGGVYIGLNKVNLNGRYDAQDLALHKERRVVQKEGADISIESNNPKDMETIIKNSPHLFELKDVEINYNDLVKNIKNQATIRLFANYFGEDDTIQGKIDIATGDNSGASEEISYTSDTTTEVIDINHLEQKTITHHKNVNYIKNGIDASYFKISPGIKYSKRVHKKIRVWLEAEYNYDQLKIKSLELKNKLQKSQGYIGLGMSIDLVDR